MFKMVGCSEKTYERIALFTKSSGGWQEDLTFFGIRFASMQYNMIGEVGDFYWCRKFLKWFL